MTFFKRTDSGDPDFIHLVTLLDKDLAERDGDEHAFYAQFNSIQSIRNAIVCYHNHNPIGCGAVKPYDKNRAEVKRMFVLPGYRGQGVGAAILHALEIWATELNYSACILETGKKQPEAIRLYQKEGYTIIENYGQYKNVDNSVCMAKSLVQKNSDEAI